MCYKKTHMFVLQWNSISGRLGRILRKRELGILEDGNLSGQDYACMSVGVS